jgi:hypothetical protein
MDRLQWSTRQLLPNEIAVLEQSDTSLYDGDEKSAFAGGKTVLTDHRILWHDAEDPNCILALSLCVITDVAESKGGFYGGNQLIQLKLRVHVIDY